MQVEFTVEVLQVSMSINEAWQYCLSGGVHHICSVRYRNFAHPPDTFESSRSNKDQRIANRRATGAVDKCPPSNDYQLVSHPLCPCPRSNAPWSPPSYEPEG